ncbi:hypothetical protein PENTCL1PPCAC_14363 [Pristionchus entomophagus]|uniref:glucuronosyltransferase n=1 Tax=Pristionchus entomophagus TaxID=358040 RepID=A0AAV5TFN2_9BILA|nr:hypothetical protein PENTCL1PPCAC_14363 [Pristionchus entomophagus]
MRTVLLLLFILPFAHCLNILMYVNVVGKSHLQYAEKLVAILNERGHSVDMVFGMSNSFVHLKGSYGAKKLIVVDFPGGSPWGAVTHLTDPFHEPSDWMRMISKSNVKTFLNTNERLCELLLDSSEVADLLSSNRYDVALISGYDLCPFALAHRYQIAPVVSFVPSAAYYTQTYNAGLPELPLYENVMFDERFVDRSSFATRLYDMIRTFKIRYDHYRHCENMNEIVRAIFGDDFPDVQDIGLNISLDFSNSHPLLEEPRPISQRIRYIGGVGLPTPKPLSKELDSMLNSAKKGNVIVSFGTQIDAEKFTEGMKRAFVNTFKRFPEYNFFWKFDGKTQMNATNIINMDWLPQTDLLNDSRVVAFICHMGLNSFTETAFAGVPVVAIPIFTDQVHNARRAAAIGIGKIVRKSVISEDNLSSALEKVLNDEKYRNRAKELSSMMNALPDTPKRIFTEGIEFAAKFQNLSSHYRLVGANHNFFVQIGWDVAAFFTVSCLLSAYLLTKLTLFVLSTIMFRMQEKTKRD